MFVLYEFLLDLGIHGQEGEAFRGPPPQVEVLTGIDEEPPASLGQLGGAAVSEGSHGGVRAPASSQLTETNQGSHLYVVIAGLVESLQNVRSLLHDHSHVLLLTGGGNDGLLMWVSKLTFCPLSTLKTQNKATDESKAKIFLAHTQNQI